MDSSYWFGVLTTLVLGLVINLITPRLETYIANRNQIASDRKKEAITIELEQVEFYSDNRQDFIEYLILSLLKIFFVICISGLFLVLLASFETGAELISILVKAVDKYINHGSDKYHIKYIDNINLSYIIRSFNFIVNLVIVFALIYILRIAQSTLSIARKVRNIKSYRLKANKILGKSS